MSGSTGLSVTDVVNVSVAFAPIAAANRNFGAAVIVGPSDVIPLAQRLRAYTSLTGVASDFGTSAPEYLAADAFFSQSPQPSFLYVGRWAQAATKGTLTGGYIAPSAQAAFLATALAVTNGAMTISFGGTPKNITSVSFASATPSMAGLAAVLNTALSPNTCVWSPSNNWFIIESSGTGVTSGAITFATPDGGTDLSSLFQLTQVTGATLSQGAAAETPLACYNAIATISNAWYGFTFAPTNAGDIVHSDYLAVAAANEASSPVRIFGVNTMEAGTVSPASTTDLAYLLQQGNFERTCIQYSSSSQYAIASLIGRAFTVDFTANNSTITLKFKQEPGITAEQINETQAGALNAKNCNVFVEYSNNTAIIQQGVMCNGYFFDEVQGTDWLASTIQTNIYNLLYTSPTKIPQTDAGVHQLVNQAEAACAQGVNNGLIAPGIWNGPPIGPIATGQFLPNGYYVYAPPISSQSQAVRDTRVAPTLQCLICLAGAVHKANVIVNVQR